MILGRALCGELDRQQPHRGSHTTYLVFGPAATMKQVRELPETTESEIRYRKLAQDYARFRPSYPEDLMEYLASVTPSHLVAWDYGTGNGQAARGISRHFGMVFAADVSFEQLTYAEKDESICYLLARAERFPVSTDQVDIVTVAQALHWFDRDSFYSEVKRVLKPGGIIAVWSYHLPQMDPEIGQIASQYYQDILGPFWSPSIRLIEDKYATISFPFEELSHPFFEMTTSWKLHQFVGFLTSWSAVPTFIEANGYHPLLAIRSDLNEVWSNPTQERLFHWPIYLRVGKLVE